MNKENLRKKLYCLFLELRKNKIPSNFHDSELKDCIDEISDLDAYYAGLALDVSQGGNISLDDLYDIDSIKKRINDICANSNEDKKKLQSYNAYIGIISEIDLILREICFNKK